MAEKSKGIQNSSIYILKGTPFQTISDIMILYIQNYFLRNVNRRQSFEREEWREYHFNVKLNIIGSGKY